MDEGPTFDGFARPNGSAGTRNHLLVLSTTGLTGPTAQRIGKSVAGAKVVTMPYASGVVGADGALRRRALIGLATHPNVGGVVVVSGNEPELDSIAAEIAETGQRVESASLDRCDQDALKLTDRGIRRAGHLAKEISREKRQQMPLSALFMALECGRSDPSSGIAANPLVGSVVDRLIDLGGTAVFGETLEWYGTEAILSERAADASVASEIRQAVRRRENAAADAGIDLVGNNPGPTNIAAGLTTLEEKSLGSVAKGGSRTIQRVLDISEKPPGPGLYVMDAPFYAPESLTGMVSAGAQLALFTTGPGNSFTSLLAPTIKLSANVETVQRLTEQIDFDASALTRGTADLQTVTDHLLARLISIASGELTWGEILDEGDEVISRLGSAL
ncbi:MAG: UxaA family hydrolase [Alphaproteobacteria bacterium]|nr:UxaA family hydrolase [Alphaproteobacteria bacterium]